MPANKITRSENFNVLETNLLLDRIEVHKAAILNRSTRSSANQRKYNAWTQIMKDFKEQGLGPERTVECLRNKWENLKRLCSPNFKKGVAINEVPCDNKRSTIARVISILNEAEKYQVADPDLNASDDDVSSKEADKKEKALWDDRLSGNEDLQSEDSMDEDAVVGSVEDRNARKSTSRLPFSPQECRILLQCVRPEKKLIFSSEEDSTENFFIREAWDRVTAAFNKASPVKRSQQNLRSKLDNMKRLAKRNSFKDYVKGLRKKHQTLVNENTLPHKIKAEPIAKEKDSEDFTDDGYNDTTADIEPIESVEQQTANGLPTLDPLSTVLNGTVGNHWMQSQHTDVVKMQIELLNFQMETAKLERQRVMSKVQADTTERKARELETSLRLRAARLEVVAAEIKLPPNHPALYYAPEERRAQQHMSGAECV